MKKTLVAAILGIAASVSVMAQGRIILESYLSGNYPTISYGAGSGGTVGVGVDSSFTVGFYYQLAGGATFTDGTGGTDIPGAGWILAAGAGSTAPILGGSLPGIYHTGTEFSVPGYVDPSPNPATPISIVIVAYNGADYASSTVRGHSQAYDITPAVGAAFGTYTGTGQNPFQVFSTTAVPEPSTFALAGLGLAGLLIFRRRK